MINTERQIEHKILLYLFFLTTTIHILLAPKLEMGKDVKSKKKIKKYTFEADKLEHN